MRDEESVPVDSKDVTGGSYEKDTEKPLDANTLEPFGNEENAEVKYRTMQWWYVLSSSFILNMANHGKQALWNA